MSLALAKKPLLDRRFADNGRAACIGGLHPKILSYASPVPLVRLKPLCPCGGGCPRCMGSHTMPSQGGIDGLGASSSDLEPRTPVTPTAESSRARLPLTSEEYPGCSEEQNFPLDVAQMRAPRWVASTIRDLEGHLSRPTETITVIESTLNRFFHPPHRPDTARTIITRLTRMMTALGNPRLFRCVSRATCGRENSAHDPEALAYAGRGTVISVCPSFFTQPINDQVSTLIHESAHHIGLMRNVIPREQVMNLPLNRALNNAESYALLVYENFVGPPVAPGPPAPEPLTDVWSPAHMSSEVMFNQPVNELFYEGRGRRRYLSSVRPSIESPFLTNRPIRFRGQVRFYVDTEDMPLPSGTTLPEVTAQILFTPFQSDTTREMYYHQTSAPQYLGPELPLVISFSPDFNFLIPDNGRLRFSFYMTESRSGSFYAMYDDTVTVIANNEI